MPIRRALLLAAPLLLAGCNSEPTPSEDDGREASGEVLEGSISDAMLPLDEVQSQAPLSEPEAAASGTAAGADPAQTGEETGGEEAESEGAPAAAADTAPAE